MDVYQPFLRFWPLASNWMWAIVRTLVFPMSSRLVDFPELGLGLTFTLAFFAIDYDF